MTFTTSPRQSRDFSPPSPLLPEKAPGVARPSIHTARLRFDRFELDEAEARLTCAGRSEEHTSELQSLYTILGARAGIRPPVGEIGRASCRERVLYTV